MDGDHDHGKDLPPVTTREPSLAELAEDVREMREENRSYQRELKADLESRDSKFLRTDLYEAHRTADRAEVSDLQQWRTFMTRAAVTAVLSPVLVAVVLYFLLGPG